MFSRGRSSTVVESQLQSSALLLGPLSQLERVGLSKSWRKHLFVLGKLDGGGAGLALYSYAQVGAGAYKLRGTIELDEGCEARPLAPEEAQRREHCFMLVTAKGQVKFQAESEEDRARWLDKLSREFEKAIEGTLDKQKNQLLKKGLLVTWHRPQQRGGGAVDVLIRGGLDDRHSPTLFLGDLARIPFWGVDEVLAGNDSDLLKAKFHFNCFTVRLDRTVAQASTGLWEGCVLLEFEAPKQSVRDDLVSAFEVQLKSMRGDATAPTSTTTATTGGGPEVPLSPMQRQAAAASVSTPSSRTTPPGPGGSALPSSPALNATTRQQSAASVASRFEDSDSDEEASVGTGTAGSAGGAAGGTGSGGGGVGEYFKQKVKLGRGFPYSRCISFALREVLQGDRAATLLTPERIITPGEATEVIHLTKLELPPTDAEIKAAHDAKKRKPPKPIHFEMSEYAPSAFRELRNRWGVTEAQYLKSLSQLSGDGAVGDGKSGMLFFFTMDRRYVLKTVKPNEMAVLVEQAMLPAYLKHMEANPDSLICRFFGLYRYKMGPKGNVRDIFLVCMQNSFDTRLVLHEKYDLKGSTRNRWCTPRFGSVLKDLNFGNSKLYLDETERADFLKQCEKDTQLFEAFNVMDYSLLLGIHKPADDADKVRRNLLLLGMAAQLEDKPLAAGPTAAKATGKMPLSSGRPVPTRWQRDFGGVESFVPEMERRPQVYIMCIIDILQAYDLGKKAENLIKSQMNEEKKEISAVNPKTYRQRFLAYLARIIVGVPGQSAVIIATRNQIKLHLANLRMLSANDGFASSRSTRTLTQGSLGSSPSAAAAAGLSALGETVIEEEDETGTTEQRSGSVVALAKKPSAPVPPPSAAATLPKQQQQQQQPQQPTSSNRSSGKASSPRPAASSTAGVGGGGSMEDAIQAAVRMAEQEKMAQGGDLYAEVLDDGTEIIMLPEGGFIQRNPDGTEIRSFPDGTVKQTNPDGSIIVCDENGNIISEQLADGTKVLKGQDPNVVHTQENPDGSVIETFRDGSTVQRNPDGSRVEVAQNGDQKTTFRDGTVVEVFRGGLKRQMNPNGVEITTLADGTRIQINHKTDPNLVLTVKPDGSRMQEDRVAGTSIFIAADGNTEEHRLNDGTVVFKDLVQVYTKQTNSDGSVLESFRDGKQKFTAAPAAPAAPAAAGRGRDTSASPRGDDGSTSALLPSTQHVTGLLAAAREGTGTRDLVQIAMHLHRAFASVEENLVKARLGVVWAPVLGLGLGMCVRGELRDQLVMEHLGGAAKALLLGVRPSPVPEHEAMYATWTHELSAVLARCESHVRGSVVVLELMDLLAVCVHCSPASAAAVAQRGDLAHVLHHLLSQGHASAWKVMGTCNHRGGALGDAIVAVAGGPPAVIQLAYTHLGLAPFFDSALSLLALAADSVREPETGLPPWGLDGRACLDSVGRVVTPQQVMTWLVSALQGPRAEARACAVRVLRQALTMHGPEVAMQAMEAQLPLYLLYAMRHSSTGLDDHGGDDVSLGAARCLSDMVALTSTGSLDLLLGCGVDVLSGTAMTMLREEESEACALLVRTLASVLPRINLATAGRVANEVMLGPRESTMLWAVFPRLVRCQDLVSAVVELVMTVMMLQPGRAVAVVGEYLLLGEDENGGGRAMLMTRFVDEVGSQFPEDLARCLELALERRGLQGLQAWARVFGGEVVARLAYGVLQARHPFRVACLLVQAGLVNVLVAGDEGYAPCVLWALFQGLRWWPVDVDGEEAFALACGPTALCSSEETQEHVGVSLAVACVRVGLWFGGAPCTSWVEDLGVRAKLVTGRSLLLWVLMESVSPSTDRAVPPRELCRDWTQVEHVVDACSGLPGPLQVRVFRELVRGGVVVDRFEGLRLLDLASRAWGLDVLVEVACSMEECRDTMVEFLVGQARSSHLEFRLVEVVQRLVSVDTLVEKVARALLRRATTTNSCTEVMLEALDVVARTCNALGPRFDSLPLQVDLWALRRHDDVTSRDPSLRSWLDSLGQLVTAADRTEWYRDVDMERWALHAVCSTSLEVPPRAFAWLFRCMSSPDALMEESTTVQRVAEAMVASGHHPRWRELAKCLSGYVRFSRRANALLPASEAVMDACVNQVVMMGTDEAVECMAALMARFGTACSPWLQGFFTDELPWLYGKTVLGTNEEMALSRLHVAVVVAVTCPGTRELHQGIQRVLVRDASRAAAAGVVVGSEDCSVHVAWLVGVWVLRRWLFPVCEELQHVDDPSGPTTTDVDAVAVLKTWLSSVKARPAPAPDDDDVLWALLEVLWPPSAGTGREMLMRLQLRH